MNIAQNERPKEVLLSLPLHGRADKLNLIIPHRKMHV